MAKTNTGETSARVVVGAGTGEVRAELARATAGAAAQGPRTQTRSGSGTRPLREGHQSEGAAGLTNQGCHSCDITNVARCVNERDALTFHSFTDHATAALALISPLQFLYSGI